MNDDTNNAMNDELDKDTQQLIERLKHISLTPDERHVLQARLEEYADFHPMPEHAAIPSPHGGIFPDILRWLGNTKSAYAFAVLVLVIGAGAGTSLAAERALPGDALYAVKVGINEQVRGALAFTPESKARLQIQLAHRRVEEAITLAERGELTTEKSAGIALRLQEHIARSESAAHALDSAGLHDAAVAARADLKATLAADVQIFEVASGKAVPAAPSIATPNPATSSAQSTDLRRKTATDTAEQPLVSTDEEDAASADIHANAESEIIRQLKTNVENILPIDQL